MAGILTQRDAKGIRQGTQRKFSFVTFAKNFATFAFKLLRLIVTQVEIGQLLRLLARPLHPSFRLPSAPPFCSRQETTRADSRTWLPFSSSSQQSPTRRAPT